MPAAEESAAALVPSAGAVAVDPEGRVLLIRRGTEPHRGAWTIPGGKCEPAETWAHAAVRELREETGLVSRPLRRLGRQVLPGVSPVEFENEDWLVEVTGGELRAGDDAEAARWFTEAELDDDLLTPGLRSWLTRYGVLGSEQPR